jgi:methylase of polypeptide subunit release factors
VSDASHRLQTGGFLIFEIGIDQSEAIQALIDLTIWDVVEIKNDLRQIPRAFVLRRK